MAAGFPLYIDLNDNNCTVFGGDAYAAMAVSALLQFGAKVTVIHPTLCEELKQMDASHTIRYLPRKYYRGDCSKAMMCVAATGHDTTNIAIATECKAKKVPINVEHPAAFGTFRFPKALFSDDLQLSLVGERSDETMEKIKDRLQILLDELSKEYRD